MDEKTKKKWANFQEENEGRPLTSYIKQKENSNIIELTNSKKCPFLNESKLCNLVTQFGEEVLSKTCTIFPREVKEFENRMEYSLVPCCPEVIDILNKQKKVTFTEFYTGDDLAALREFMITLIQDDTYTISKSMMMLFFLLLDLYDKGEGSVKVFLRSKPELLLEELIDAIDQMEFSKINTFDENNELFLDLIQNYRKEGLYSDYLEEIAEEAEEFSEGYEEEVILKKLEEFEKQFKQYEPLFRKYLAVEFFNDLVVPESDLWSVVVMFQWITLEYAMIRHAIFLTWMLDASEEIPYQAVRDAIVILSRMTGYEAEDIYEYLENCFEEIIWDWGYLALLVGI